MKTRVGFVSNSSSSSFICCVPPNFDLSDSEIKKIWDSGVISNMKDITLEDLKGLWKEFKKHGYIGYDNDYYSVGKLVKAVGFLLGKIDGGPEDGACINMYDEQVLNNVRVAEKFRKI